jgi:succinoglycan biosynthesis transport protein ExoP
MVLGLSLVLGVLMGAAFGALNEFNERFFRTGEDVRDWLGVKFLGYLPLQGAMETKLYGAAPEPANPSYLRRSPRSESAQARRSRMRIAVDAPASMFAETLRNAKIACDVVLQGSNSRIIGVVSVLPAEGKSTVAANLAALLAANGSKTLLIDGDLRNPGLTRALGIKSKVGLVEAVVSEEPWQSVLKVERQTKLAIIPAVVRRQFSHSSELLSSAGMRRLLDEARQSFEYIIVDLPPLGPVVDAKAFAPFADGFVLVAEWGRTPRALLRSILHSETLVAKKVLGLVLNKVELKKLAKYGSFGSSGHFLEQYSTYYRDAEVRPKKAFWRPDVPSLRENGHSALAGLRSYLGSGPWSRFFR